MLVWKAMPSMTDDLGDLLRRGFDGRHGGDHLADHVAALRGDAVRADGELVGLAGVLGVLAHGGGQFLHRGGGSSRLAACCSVRRDRSLLPEAISPAARVMLEALAWIWPTIWVSCDGGVGIVAHACEHALVVAVHACGQVTFGDGRQQLRACRGCHR
jgi:hypothetical protein